MGTWDGDNGTRPGTNPGILFAEVPQPMDHAAVRDMIAALRSELARTDTTPPFIRWLKEYIGVLVVLGSIVGVYIALREEVKDKPTRADVTEAAQRSVTTHEYNGHPPTKVLVEKLRDKQEAVENRLTGIETKQEVMIEGLGEIKREIRRRR